MLQLSNAILLAITPLILLACEQPQSDFSEQSSATSDTPQVTIQATITGEKGANPQQTASVLASLPASAFKTLEWTDLMPKEDLKALLNPPSYVTDIKDHGQEEQTSKRLKNTRATASDDPYQKALTSTQIVQQLDGQAIRLAGFIVPLEFDDEQTITQFFLVPFFGACIHLPPPPPNQIIFVKYPQGLKLEALYDPFWVSGILQTSLVKNDTAVAAYSLQMQSFEAYTE